MVVRAMAEGKKQQERRQTRLERQKLERNEPAPIEAKQPTKTRESEGIPEWFPFPELGKKILDETKDLRELTQTAMDEVRPKKDNKRLPPKTSAKEKKYTSSEGQEFHRMQSTEGTEWKKMESNEGISTFSPRGAEKLNKSQIELTEIRDDEDGGLQLDPAFVVQGVIWSEVLQPPKAKRLK